MTTTTTTLTDALARATKGPMKVVPSIVDKPGLSLAHDIKESDGTLRQYVAHVISRHDCPAEINAALLAHCRRELPALVEAASDIVKYRDGSLHGADEFDLYDKLREALRSAQNVRVQG